MKMEKFLKAAEYITQHLGKAEIAIVLGSGLSGYEERLSDRKELSYAKIPGFPKSTAPGHAGKLIIGSLDDKRVLLMSGRFHSYEGYSMNKVTFPIRVFCLMGIKYLILTNAAGGVNHNFQVGQLMLITDYINFTGRNPLRGKNLDEFGPRFPDMSQAFSPKLRKLAFQEAEKMDIPLQQGVYCWFNGPTYETPAEIRTARILGADAVGMSTVPETIVARHCGMEVLGISVITNLAAGMSEQALSHEEVLESGKKVKQVFSKLIDAIILQI